MSLLSKLAKKAGKVLKKVAPLIPGPIGTIAGAVLNRGGGGGTGAATTASMFPVALPPIAATVGRALPAIGRALPGIGRATGQAVGRVAGAGRALVRKYPKSARALAELGLFAVGGVVYDAATGQPVGTVNRRRMNPLNARALRRAMSRVKSAKNICRQVEKLTGGARRRAAPCPPPSRRRC